MTFAEHNVETFVQFAQQFFDVGIVQCTNCTPANPGIFLNPFQKMDIWCPLLGIRTWGHRVLDGGTGIWHPTP